MENGVALLEQEAEAIPDSQVLEQLERLLASTQLRNSKRHHRLLSFLISASLRGENAEIKERVLGIEVFGRPADYDVSNDTIVRGAVADLRKRLTLYYADPSHVRELHIEVPLGGYVPRLYWPAASLRPSLITQPPLPSHEPEAEPASHVAPLHNVAAGLRGSVTKWAIVGIVLAATATLGWYVSPTQRVDRAFDSFWSAATEGSGSVLICVGSLNHIMLQPAVENDTWTHVTLTRNHIDPNAGAALMNVSSVLGAKGKKLKFVIADTATLADLRGQRAVYIGGRSNQWAVRLQSGLRFRISSANGASAILDTMAPAHAVATFDGNEQVSSISHDYGLITRAVDPLTELPVLALSGLGSYGTFTASEFVSDPRSVSVVIHKLPRGWEHETLQIVVRADVVDGKASPPQVVAFDVR